MKTQFKWVFIVATIPFIFSMFFKSVRSDLTIKIAIQLYGCFFIFAMVIVLLAIYFIEDSKKFVVADTRVKIGMLITFILGVLYVVSKVMERHGK